MSRLERWSRRKRGLDAEAPEPREAPEAVDATAESPQGPADEPLPPGALDDALPDPETLPPGSDFSQYLRDGVSQALKRRALRRLWQSDGYGVRDGLDDYDHDYTRLKPLAREAAERLRHWTRKLDESLAEATDETTTAVADAREAPEDGRASPDEPADDTGEAPPPPRDPTKV